MDAQDAGLGRHLAKPFSQMWSGGHGPSHSSISAALASAGVPEVVEGNKEDRVVRGFLSCASDDQARQLAAALYADLADSGALDGETQAWANRASRLHRALAEVGGEPGPGGVLNWLEPGPAAAIAPDELSSSREPHSPPATRGTYYFNSADPTYGGRIKPHTKDAMNTSGANIFLVHGHDDALRNRVENYIYRMLGKHVNLTVLARTANRGRTLIEKFEDEAALHDYAIVLASPDDIGGKDQGADTHFAPRSRENVVFELGYFMGKLGRGRVCLVNSGAPMPSDLQGVVYVSADGHLFISLARELRAAGFEVDPLR